MGKPNADAGDHAIKVVSGSLDATGSGDWTTMDGPFHIVISGTWVGSWALEASMDGGTTALNCVMPDGMMQPGDSGGMTRTVYAGWSRSWRVVERL